MTLSIEVLPAPLGPMMARISPLRMSKETSDSAFTPPNESDTPSTDRMISPAATSIRLRGLMSRSPSCGLLHDRRHSAGNVVDRNARVERAAAAVLEGDLGRDRGLARAVVERLDQRGVSFGDEAAAHLERARELAVVGVKLFWQDEEPPDLRARQ